MRASLGAPSCVLLVLLALCAAAPSSSTPASTSSNRMLRDTRKLQPAVFLKAAAQQLQQRQDADAAACARDYGSGYLQRWRALGGTFCNTTAAAAAGSSVSSGVACHAHPEADISTCLARNLLLRSTTGFIGASPSRSELPQPAAGSVHLACNRTAPPQTFLRGRLQSNEGSRAWLVTAPTFGPASSVMQHACSEQHRVRHAVLLLSRVDPQNAFHNLEAVLSVFAALAVLQLQPLQHGLQVVVADDRQAGYFMPIWQRLSWPHPVRVLRQQPFPDNTCFVTAVLAPYTAHAQSLLTYKAGSADEVLCESVVLQGASRWLRHLFRDLLPPSQRPGAATAAAGDGQPHGGKPADSTTGGSSRSQGWSRLHGYGGHATLDLAPVAPSPTQSARPLELLYVVWLSRRRFEQQHAARLTDWQKARALPAEQQEQVVTQLQQAVLQWNEATCASPGQHKDCQARGVMFSLQVLELSELSFYPDAVGVMMRAGVLAGVHGAGLANQVFMRPRRGAVVEVWHHMEGNTHYHNMAHMLGHAYAHVKAEEGEVLNVGAVAAAVKAGMDEVAARHDKAGAAQSRRRRGGWWRGAGAGRAAARSGE